MSLRRDANTQNKVVHQGLVTGRAFPLSQHPTAADHNMYEDITPQSGLKSLPIRAGDLVYRNRAVSMSTNPGKFGPRVFAAINGMKCPFGITAGGSAHKSKYEDLRHARYQGGLSFAGVALTDATPESRGRPSPISLATGGSTTTVNSGQQTIYQGMHVQFYLPEKSKKHRGSEVTVQTEKRRGILVPALRGYWPHENRIAMESDIVNAFRNAPTMPDRLADTLFSAGDKEESEEKDFRADAKIVADVMGGDKNLSDALCRMMQSMFTQMFDAQEEVRASTIGTATNMSEVGKRLDLNLHPC
jgi:hypothetical protein